MSVSKDNAVKLAIEYRVFCDALTDARGRKTQHLKLVARHLMETQKETDVEVVSFDVLEGVLEEDVL